MIYFAYGSNLSIQRIKERCDSAYVMGKTMLYGYRLAFQENNKGRVVANLIVDDDSYVDGMLYHINSDQIDLLDTYEGHPFVYKRQEVRVVQDGEWHEVWTYIMPQTKTYYTIEKRGVEVTYIPIKVKRAFGVPENEYLSHIVKGYKDFRLPKAKLKEALKYSGENTKRSV